MGRKTVFWGADERGRWALNYAQANQIEVECFIDSDPTNWNTVYNGKKVYQPEYLSTLKGDIEVIVTTYPVYAKQILLQLEDTGFVYGKNAFLCADKLKINQFIEKKFKKASLIQKGGTGNKKYCVETDDGNKRFLQFTDISQFVRSKKQYEILSVLSKANIPVSTPIEFTEISKWGGYLCFEWSDGEDIRNTLPLFSKKNQYELGFKAGTILHQIHNTPIFPHSGEWAFRPYDKISQIDQYRICGVNFSESEEILIKFIKQHYHLITKQPVCFLHGDYHMGNILLEHDEIKIVDFDGFRFGSIWSDFSRISWNAPKYPFFSTGILDGYFGGKLSSEAWSLFTLYTVIDAINVTLNIAFLNENTIKEKRLKRNNDLLHQFNNMQNTIPSWYRSDFAHTISKIFYS